MKIMPDIIKKVGFDFRWDNKKVWALQYPTEEINISELEWHFDIPFLSTEEGYYDLKPSEIMSDPSRYKKEHERTMNCNISHPIDIMKNNANSLLTVISTASCGVIKTTGF